MYRTFACQYNAIFAIGGSFSFSYTNSEEVDTIFVLYTSTTDPNSSNYTPNYVELANMGLDVGTKNDVNIKKSSSNLFDSGFGIGIRKGTSDSNYRITNLNVNLNIYYF